MVNKALYGDEALCGLDPKEVAAFRAKTAPHLRHGFDTLTSEQQAAWARELLGRRRDRIEDREKLAGEIAVAAAGAGALEAMMGGILGQHAIEAAEVILPDWSDAEAD